MSQIITNANAPRVKITIDVDFRYNPPAYQVDCSQTMPALVIQGCLMTCALNLNAMMQQAEKQRQSQDQAVLPPNLPPAPQSN